MKRWLIPLIFLSSLAFGQSGPLPDQNCVAYGAVAPTSNLACTNTGPYASGTQQFLPDIRGTITNQFEIVVIGTAPSTLTTTFVGCMRGGTCSGTLASSSGTTSQIVTPTAANLNIYDKYGVTLSWTGGDATTRFVVNRTGTTARLSGGAGGAGTVSANNGSAGALANYAAAGGSTTVGPDATLLDNGINLIYSGTHGVEAPDGTCANPAYQGTSLASGMFFHRASADIITWCFTGTGGFEANSASSEIIVNSSWLLAWASGNVTATSKQTAISQPSAGILSFDDTTTGGGKAKIQASGLISKGTKFTTNNGCTDSATAGGATAGTFTVGSTSCTEVVTMGDTATAPNGWSCTVVDITTLADVTNPHQTTSNATTATFVTGTVASGDKIQFSCIGY